MGLMATCTITHELPGSLREINVIYGGSRTHFTITGRILFNKIHGIIRVSFQTLYTMASDCLGLHRIDWRYNQPWHIYVMMTSSHWNIFRVTGPLWGESIGDRWGNHRSPIDSRHEGQLHRASIFSLTCAWTNVWANSRSAGDFRRLRPHYGVTVMILIWFLE